MRLIDADELIKCLDYCAWNDATEVVNAQPTAYDADAVVEELKKTNKSEVNAGMCTSGFIHCLTAIDIVKRGGAE